SRSRTKSGCSHRSFNAMGSLTWLFVFPHTHYNPASSEKLLISVPVTELVQVNLAMPILGIRACHGAMLGAAVPEAAVHEHSDAFATEHKIGRPPHIRQRAHSHAVAKPKGMDSRAKRPLGASIPGLVTKHRRADMRR